MSLKSREKKNTQQISLLFSSVMKLYQSAKGPSENRSGGGLVARLCRTL